jgi:hypothetical protein
MFKRTIRLLQEQKPFNQIKDKHAKILDYYTPNDHILEKLDKVPYELTGEYLPKRKVNPYRKAPLQVTYHHHDFASFVLPSRRHLVYGFFGIEELFGIKRWRNDSPFIKEYIKVDNQIFVILILSLVLILPFYWYRHRLLTRGFDDYITSGYGKFTADDLN